ncbi:efflux RND transporter periplasmic adaptor subunit [Syntrophothermus lipocalidus]|uniref:Efflux transporter, RND family, MFP subunit n=1 Tax=Syntrophothermus lipocalidus (strain DSM 12680 / TGB-C1) TaxID=643648 RepID=D7CPT1_SYNLT|nr:efflux RND transporter periplasmic adaptor subunit [Syntrophothermus lipocalidus]ADI02709.1 efflux transporter, RND family, MFP subunit [Syntrophothermus lipocalidus DSM 12680]
MWERVRKVLAGLVVLVLLGTGAAGCGNKKEEAVEPAQIPVQVEKARLADVEKIAVYSGTLRGVEEAVAYPKLSAAAGAVKVVEVMVKPGDRVSQGQTLIRLDSGDLEYQIRAYEAQLAGLVAQREGAQVRLSNLKQTLDRTRFLYDQGAVSKSDLERAETEYEAAVAGLKQIDAGIAGAQANLDNARRNLANCNVPSPVGGTVGTVNVSAGDSVTAQTPVTVVSNTSRLEVQVNVAEAEISYVKPGAQVKVYVQAASPEPFTGTVDTVATTADSRMKTYPVKILLDNPKGMLKSGMFAEVHLPTMVRHQVVAVPQEAVVAKGARRVVYVVDSKSVAHERPVTVGVENENLAEITEGLKAGEPVVVKGSTLIRDGDKVKVVAGGVDK